MLDHAREALEYSKGATRQGLIADRIRHLALVHLVVVVGEAASRLSPVEQARYPEIPWRNVVGTRNRLIHGYDNVNEEALWEILTHDLPDLVAKLERSLGEAHREG